MSELMHTPGPWGFYTKPQPNGCPIVGARGLMVAVIAHSVNQPKQKEIALANAHLVTAAPDMLKALEDLQAILCDPEGEPCFHGSDGDFAVARSAFAVIEKAKGGAE